MKVSVYVDKEVTHPIGLLAVSSFQIVVCIVCKVCTMYKQVTFVVCHICFSNFLLTQLFFFKSIC